MGIQQVFADLGKQAVLEDQTLCLCALSDRHNLSYCQ